MTEVLYICNNISSSLIINKSYSTSSARFEIESAYALSEYKKVTIVNYKLGSSSCVKIKDNLYVTSFASRLSMILFLFKKSRGSILIFTGYDLKKVMLSLAYKIINKSAVYSYIYDSHEITIKNKTWMKKKLINLYFSFGFFMSKKLTGWLVFNDSFIINKKIKVNYHKTGLGLENKYKSKNKYTYNEVPILLFSGTLNNDNCILELIEAVKNLESIVLLHIYGDGELSNKVLELSKSINNVKYFGRVDNQTLEKAIDSSDILVNLRAIDSVSNLFAFPSKIAHYIQFEKKIISTPLPEMYEHLSDSYQKVNSVDNIIIREAIFSSLKSDLNTQQRKEIILNNSWDFFAFKLNEFLKN